MDAAGAPRPARRPRLVALDLDGTTVDLEQRLHPRTRAAVHAAVASGVHVVAATGRMYRSALPWARELGLRAPLICYQGALVRAMPDQNAPVVDGVPQGRLVADDPLDGVAAIEVVGVARASGWHRQAYCDDMLLCEEDRPEAHFYARIAQVGITFVDDLLATVASGSTKVVCVVLDDAEARWCETVLGGAVRTRARVIRSLPQFVEVTSPQASKGRALQRVCSELGVDLSEVVAIGDAPNDVDMMDAVGFAVAVETARPEVFAAADATCAPPEQAGVAAVLEALGLAV